MDEHTIYLNCREVDVETLVEEPVRFFEQEVDEED